MDKEKYALYGIFTAALILAFYIIFSLVYTGGNPNSAGKNNFKAVASSQNNVEFQVTPLSASEFRIAVNTHSVSLDFDLAGISELYDSFGNAYKPLKWEGSAPGGHHRSGTLKFPQISANSESIRLVINDGAEREFYWSLR